MIVGGFSPQGLGHQGAQISLLFSSAFLLLLLGINVVNSGTEMALLEVHFSPFLLLFFEKWNLRS